jgi:Yip1 domain
MNIVSRAKNLLLNPKAEWPNIANEPGTAGYLFPNYVMILSAIPPLCHFIGYTFVGYGDYRTSFGGGVLRAVAFYLLALGVVYLTAYIIDGFAGVFGGRMDFPNALRVSSYWGTAGWLAGAFNLIPNLSFLVLLGLYGIYILYTGLVVLMKAPPDKATIYTGAVFVCATILTFAISALIVWLGIKGLMA